MTIEFDIFLYLCRFSLFLDNNGRQIRKRGLRKLRKIYKDNAFHSKYLEKMPHF